MLRSRMQQACHGNVIKNIQQIEIKTTNMELVAWIYSQNSQNKALISFLFYVISKRSSSFKMATTRMAEDAKWLTPGEGDVISPRLHKPKTS